MKGRLGVLGLVVLLLADAVLVAWALGLLPGGGEDPAARSGTSQTTSSAPSPTSLSTSNGPATQRPVLEALDADRAWRASFTPCEDDEGEATVEIERTADGGKTWESSEVPARSVLRLRMSSETQGFAVIADDTCKPAVVTTGDGGETWGEPEKAESTWGLWPDGGSEVLVPGGVSAEACVRGDVLALSALDGQEALVLCEDGAIRRTTDTGQAWSSMEKAENAVSLSARDRKVVVLLESQDCDGLGVRAGELEDALELGEASCVEGVSEPAGISIADGVGWVSDGQTIVKSSDLDTWTHSDPA